MLKTRKTATHLLKHRISLRIIAELAGVTYEGARHASSRNHFNSKDLQSIVRYITQTRKKKKLPELS